jgi:hypothetical protein
MKKLVVVAFAFSLFGCKFLEKKVPEDIVQKALNQSLRHLGGTASAMCGGPTKGIINATVTIKSRGEKNTGVAHVKGSPWPTAGEDLPSKCEGDIEYAFSYKTKTYGIGKKKKTETTWFLDSVKLTAVQTEGVKFKGEKEESNDPDKDGDDDEEVQPASKTDSKKKAKKSDDD